MKEIFYSIIKWKRILQCYSGTLHHFGASVATTERSLQGKQNLFIIFDVWYGCMIILSAIMEHN